MKITTELVYGLPRKELIEKIHFHHRQGEVAERSLGFYLLDLERQGLFEPSENAAHWALVHLGFKRADKLILLSEQLEELPAIEAAFNRGDVGWTKIREIARVASPQTEEEWLEFARKRTSRELERAVAGVKKGHRPGEGLKARRKRCVIRVPSPWRGTWSGRRSSGRSAPSWALARTPPAWWRRSAGGSSSSVSPTADRSSPWWSST
jgi:hypothetical protein